MTYSYKDHGRNENYADMKNIKWIVKECTKDIFNDIANKQLNICNIPFYGDFNQSTDALSKCTQF